MKHFQLYLSKIVQSLLVVLPIVTSNFLHAQKEERPNIILIITDQHNARALGSTGNKAVNTPNLDKLANSGIRFEKTYVTFPLCTPSRSSIFTGKMPHTLGVHSNKEGDNKINPLEKKHVLGKLLTEAGYDCAYGGKWHAHEANMVAGNGFEFIAPMGDIGLAEKSIAYLNSKKDSKKPFFMVVSYDNPHNICEWARNEPLPYGNVNEPKLSLTPQLPKNFKKSKKFPEVLNWEQQANKKVYPTAYYSKEDWRQYLYAYYQLVEKVDHEIGKILNAVDQLKLKDNTLILFTSDHGDGNAAHGWNQKTILFEEAVRVPFVASFKGKIKPGKVNTHSVISNGLDLYPTICDYAKIVPPENRDGKSLKKLFEEKENNLNRKFVVIETKFEGKQALGTMGRAVVSKRYKYILYNWGKHREQLFDLENDPLEMNNLANSKKHLKILDTYREYLHKWCSKTKDYKFLKKIILPSKSTFTSDALFLTPY
ncbi:sulfatase family protein [Flavicella sediminum]|uniref:sulfatase family protein n=1 Tax=Flavicella sediminum TaxID=2585141 RepID=UPI00111CEB7A|nr:sulfatase-like hydrolase/transferase [Flavicella sediminum]